VIEFHANVVAVFMAAQAAADCCRDLTFSVFVIGREADYDFLAWVVPIVADGAAPAAGKVNHVNFINYAPFMRIQPYAPHVQVDRSSRMPSPFYASCRCFKHTTVLLLGTVLFCIGFLTRQVKQGDKLFGIFDLEFDGSRPRTTVFCVKTDASAGKKGIS